jgi:hypothetical protein
MITRLLLEEAYLPRLISLYTVCSLILRRTNDTANTREKAWVL